MKSVLLQQSGSQTSNSSIISMISECRISAIDMANYLLINPWVAGRWRCAPPVVVDFLLASTQVDCQVGLDAARQKFWYWTQNCSKLLKTGIGNLQSNFASVSVNSGHVWYVSQEGSRELKGKTSRITYFPSELSKVEGEELSYNMFPKGVVQYLMERTLL